MKFPAWRRLATILILITAVVVFGYYFHTHPEVGRQLRHTSPLLLLGLLVLYGCFMVTLSLINMATLRLCKTRLPSAETFTLTAYSSIINFFGPLQSGPAFRGLYLKQKHGVSLKNYSLATFMYYGFFALYSGLFLMSGLLGWWILVITLFGVLIGLYVLRSQRLTNYRRALDVRAWPYIAAATLAQTLVFVAIYFVELHSVMPSVSLSQVIIYTGAANFALFVSLTPGAIGFRESFLLFSQQLHHVSNNTIIAANIIDRSVYVLLLVVLMIAITVSHAKRRFDFKAVSSD